MKNILILFFLTFSCMTYAQTTQDFDGMDEKVEELAKTYNLDAEQKDKLRLLLLDKHIETSAMSDIANDDFAKSKKKFEANQKYHDGLNAILTQQQKDDYKAKMSSEMMQRNKKGSAQNTTNKPKN